MRNLPTITRYLLASNCLILLATLALRNIGLDLNAVFGLHYVLADQFHWWQMFTYMFMHANLWHLFCNMFAIYIFGPILEHEWGERRYLIYYLVCGVGAALVQEIVWAGMYQTTFAGYGPEMIGRISNGLITVGASGAVFGILFAFGWLFPDAPMYLMLIPIPVRARTMVILYALFELWEGIGTLSGGSADNVAHFAHLGGLLFGWLLLLWWRHNNWHNPQIGRRLRKLWDKIRYRHPRLDSSKDKDYSGYHYHKRV